MEYYVVSLFILLVHLVRIYPSKIWNFVWQNNRWKLVEPNNTLLRPFKFKLIVYGWRDGAKFTKFIVHSHSDSVLSLLFIYSHSTTKFIFRKYINSHFKTYFLIHEYIYSHLRQDLRDVLIHAWCLFNSYVYLSTFSSLCGLAFPG